MAIWLCFHSPRCAIFFHLQHSPPYSAPASTYPALSQPSMHLAIVISEPGTVPRPYVRARPLLPSLLKSTLSATTQTQLEPIMRDVRIASHGDPIAYSRIHRRAGCLVSLVDGQPIAAAAGLCAISTACSGAVAGIDLDTASGQRIAAEALGIILRSGVGKAFAKAKRCAHIVGHFRIGSSRSVERSAHVTVHQSAAAGRRISAQCAFTLCNIHVAALVLPAIVKLLWCLEGTFLDGTGLRNGEQRERRIRDGRGRSHVCRRSTVKARSTTRSQRRLYSYSTWNSSSLKRRNEKRVDNKEMKRCKDKKRRVRKHQRQEQRR